MSMTGWTRRSRISADDRPLTDRSLARSALDALAGTGVM
jgi:hypothetical protein